MQSSLIEPAIEAIICSVRYEDDTPILRLEWVNYRIRKDKGLIMFDVVTWLIFAPAAVVVTYIALFSAPNGAPALFWVYVQYAVVTGFLLTAWGITLAIPYKFRQLWWLEWVQFSEKALSFGYSGLWAPPVSTFPLGDIHELVLGYCGDTGDKESFMTLNVFYLAPGHKTPSRAMWGTWVAPDLKIRLYAVVERFVLARGIHLRVKNETI